MSVYNSSESNTFKESWQTKRSRIKVIAMCRKGFYNTRFKLIKILEEVPATFDKKYHADFGILLTTKDYETQYFFIIEIDGSVGHGTPITSRKEYDRNELFEKQLGVITIRLPLPELIEIDSASSLTEYFSGKIWNPFFFNYIQPSRSPQMEINQTSNQIFASFIANNTGTKCYNCNHLNHDHDLCGCSYRYAVDEKRKCNCTSAFLRSDK